MNGCEGTEPREVVIAPADGECGGGGDTPTLLL